MRIIQASPKASPKTGRCIRVSIFYVTLPAVWLVLVEHIIKRGKLVVSGGVARGRVARGVIGVMTPKDMTSHAQAQKPTQRSATGNREPQQGRRPLAVLED